MPDARFDLLFDGTLKPEADPADARQRLRAVFKLDAAGIERLFGGKPVMIKRDVDAATAARFKRIFDEAGAILGLTLIESSEAPANQPAATHPPQAPGALQLAPMDGFLEEPHEVKMLDLDTSYLSLVPGPEWSLEDCEPRLPQTRLPDISHLTLADKDEGPDDDQDLR
ncbi:hypothetical protein [Thiocystis violacea]|uniref:hypothetical protein n=1 Tax=Thiocystis violacea TaxID=13725 RepID=UPI00190382CE|nr:hypothetical protein [Thiocystis violacea]MBK1717520.1 hypothetical protein [Thiocystis violacea]